ncbi:hypothetical protein AGLY_000202 [Aphis glycines]|uniref:Uncharacterized protein n=1 Tax=Aphis glycines TaxID=307491 RepID=A0A6G0U7A7_APHGL|nr:hypothetical protein AGLY_000202 [Aphis glycines]
MINDIQRTIGNQIFGFFFFNYSVLLLTKHRIIHLQNNILVHKASVVIQVWSTVEKVRSNELSLMNTYLIKSLLSYNDISSSNIDLKMYNILICGYFINNNVKFFEFLKPHIKPYTIQLKIPEILTSNLTNTNFKLNLNNNLVNILPIAQYLKIHRQIPVRHFLVTVSLSNISLYSFIKNLIAYFGNFVLNFQKNQKFQWSINSSKKSKYFKNITVYIVNTNINIW